MYDIRFQEFKAIYIYIYMYVLVHRFCLMLILQLCSNLQNLPRKVNGQKKLIFLYRVLNGDWNESSYFIVLSNLYFLTNYYWYSSCIKFGVRRDQYYCWREQSNIWLQDDSELMIPLEQQILGSKLLQLSNVYSGCGDKKRGLNNLGFIVTLN